MSDVFTPFFNRVLIERPIKEKIGSILLPDSIQKNHAKAEGTITRVGPTCDDQVKAALGKKVIFARYSGDWIKLGEEQKEYSICNDEDILGEAHE